MTYIDVGEFLKFPVYFFSKFKIHEANKLVNNNSLGNINLLRYNLHKIKHRDVKYSAW